MEEHFKKEKTSYFILWHLFKSLALGKISGVSLSFKKIHISTTSANLSVKYKTGSFQDKLISLNLF